MKRGGPIARSPMKRRTSKRVLERTDADRAWLAFVHNRPCVGESTIIDHVCERRTEQSHDRNMTGWALKEPESRSVPMCGQLADEWEEHRGPFKGWSSERRHAYMDACIAAEQAAYARGDGVPF